MLASPSSRRVVCACRRRGSELPSCVVAPVDVVIASDVLYAHEHFRELCKSLDALAGPATKIFIALESRDAREMQAISHLRSIGFEVYKVRSCGWPTRSRVCVRVWGRP